MKPRINIFTGDNQVILVREVNNFINEFTGAVIDVSLADTTDPEGNEWLTILLVYEPIILPKNKKEDK